jgi:hypothetical protein
MTRNHDYHFDDEEIDRVFGGSSPPNGSHGTTDQRLTETQRTETLRTHGPPREALSVSPSSLSDPIHTLGLDRPLFSFARECRAISANVEDHAIALQEWHAKNCPPVSFDRVWVAFRRRFRKVESPAGEGPIDQIAKRALTAPLPPEAERFSDPTFRSMVALCHELQRIAGNEPFRLTCRAAGATLGISHTHAHEILDELVDRGVLQVVEKGRPNRATRYRYMTAGDDTETRPRDDQGR